MKHPYYIKMVYARAGGRPEKVGVKCNLHFAEAQRLVCNNFVDATSFLLYETARGGGAQAIFARGDVHSITCRDVFAEDPVYDQEGTKYPMAAEVQYNRIVEPQNGVFLKEIYELCPRIKGRLEKPTMGGLIGITVEEFKSLSSALDGK